MDHHQRRQESLDELHTRLSFVLIQTAKVFAKRPEKNLHHVNAQMKALIPRENNKFHSALDELECEILRAKSVLTCDLEDIRAREAEERRIADAARAEAARQDPSPKVEGVHPAEEQRGDETRVAVDETSIDHDVVMMDDLNVLSTGAAGHDAPAKEEITLPTGPQLSPVKDDTKPATNLSPAPDVKPDASQNDNSHHQEPGVPQEATSATQTSIPGPDDMDFDSLFNETSPGEGTGANLNLNLDIDFSTIGREDGGVAQPLENPNLGTSNATGAAEQSAESGSDAFVLSDSSANVHADLDALLPGLESYAHAAAAAAAAADPSQPPLMPAAGQAEPDPATTSNIPDDTLPAGDTTFEELFFDATDFNLDGAPGGEEPGTDAYGGGTEFDDAIFGMGGT